MAVISRLHPKFPEIQPIQAKKSQIAATSPNHRLILKFLKVKLGILAKVRL
ncbi:uncharacterized protein METZ01_LOCUS390426, partial [marine metagenome]